MGFREGAYATVWEVNAEGGNFSKIRLSTSRKDKKTDEYITDFSGFSSLIGEAHNKLGMIKDALASNGNRCRIKIGSCDVSNRYDKEAKKEYTNFTIFDFEMVDGNGNSSSGAPAPAAHKPDKTSPLTDNGGSSGDGDGDLPF